MDDETKQSKVIGERVRLQRKKRRWTQTKLAELIDISTSFLGHIERGTRIASFKTITGLADALEVSVDYLLGRTRILGKIYENELLDKFDAKTGMFLNELFALLDKYGWTNNGEGV